MRLLICLTILSTGGCIHFLKPAGLTERRPEPLLSTEISDAELIAHLNRQRNGLQNWRASTVRLEVSGPGIPFKQRLTGEFVCAAPRCFRITASNVVASLDFGANQEGCWAWSQPGAPALLTWPHEDAHLLSELPGELPWLDAEWLAVLAGVVPVSPEQYAVHLPPDQPLQRWLIRTRETVSGQLKEILKVDLVSGCCKEALVLNSDGVELVRTQLDDYQVIGSNTIPQRLFVHAPQAGFKLNLQFEDVTLNADIPEQVWVAPATRDLRVADLASVVEFHHMSQQDRRYQIRNHVQNETLPEFDDPLLVRREEQPAKNTSGFRWPWQWWR